MSIKKRLADLEEVVRARSIAIPDAERIQMLRVGESVEERKAVLVGKCGSGRGALFLRIKG